MSKDKRQSDLSKIHIAKKDLGIDDDDYRNILWMLARVRSAKDLDASGRAEILRHFRKLGWREKRRRRQPQVNNDHTGHHGRDELLAKIEAQLADMGLAWGYADGIARRIAGVESVRWANPEQLRKIVAALSYEQKKRGLLATIDDQLTRLGRDRSWVDARVRVRKWQRDTPTLEAVAKALNQELAQQEEAAQ